MKFIDTYLTEGNENDPEGERLVAKYDLIYNGWWDAMESFTFTDEKLQATFTAKDEAETIKKLKDMKAAFANAK